MRWIVTVECVAEDGMKSTIDLGTISRAAGGTVTENVAANQVEFQQTYQMRPGISRNPFHEFGFPSLGSSAVT